MVLFQIGENAQIKDDARRPVHFKPLRGGLHHHDFTALIQHFPEIFMQQIGLRRTVVGGNDVFSFYDLDGADEPRFISGIFQYGAHHIGRAGFSLVPVIAMVFSFLAG